MEEILKILLCNFSFALALQELTEYIIKLAFQLVSLWLTYTLITGAVLRQVGGIDTVVGHVIVILALVELHQELLGLECCLIRPNGLHVVFIV